MRTFYVFKINKEMSILLKDSPYNLYKTLEGIYFLNKEYVSYGACLLEQLISLIDVAKFDRLLYEKNKDNDFYMKIGSHHKIVNKYRKEETNIFVKRTHLLITTNVLSKNLSMFLDSNNLFVCDFYNKDYFWLSKIFVKS